MNALLRKTVAVVMIGGAPLLVSRGSAADEAAQDGFAGSWITWWEQDGGFSPCSRMDVVAESEDLLDGMWAAPGLNGVLHGAVLEQSDGLEWQGEWRDAEGGTGGFDFVLAPDGDRFEGTYTLEEGEDEHMWNGVRLVEGDIPEAPCVFEG
jgi:hypothetical protein